MRLKSSYWVDLQLSEGLIEAVASDESLGGYEGIWITCHVNFPIKFLSILMSRQLASLRMEWYKRKSKEEAVVPFMS